MSAVLDNTRFASGALFTDTSVALHAATRSGLAPQDDTAVAIAPTGGGVGAVVTGLDAYRPLTAGLVLRLRRALDEHHILIYKGQSLSDAAFLSFSTYFGSVFHSPADVPVLGSSDHGGVAPDVVRVSNTEGGYTGTGELTPHTDHQWTPLPSAGSLLYAIELPQRGGDTSWYNLARAYDDLDVATRQRIDGLQLITYNPFVRRPGEQRPRYRTPEVTPLGHGFPHPLVRTHPSSGRRLLFLSTHTEVELVGVPPEEGQALIERLREHLQQARYRYTHHWQIGDIVHWDNQATLHARTAFDANERRVLKRVSLAGARPF